MAYTATESKRAHLIRPQENQSTSEHRSNIRQREQGADEPEPKRSRTFDSASMDFDMETSIHPVTLPSQDDILIEVRIDF